MTAGNSPSYLALLLHRLFRGDDFYNVNCPFCGKNFTELYRHLDYCKNRPSEYDDFKKRTIDNNICNVCKKRIIKDYEYPEDFYNSYKWAEKRIEILKRDNYRCIYCGQLANHVDHTNSAKFYPKMALDPNNLVSTCKSCHDKRHGRTINNDR